MMVRLTVRLNVEAYVEQIFFVVVLVVGYVFHLAAAVFAHTAIVIERTALRLTFLLCAFAVFTRKRVGQIRPGPSAIEMNAKRTAQLAQQKGIFRGAPSAIDRVTRFGLAFIVVHPQTDKVILVLPRRFATRFNWGQTPLDVNCPSM